MLCCAQRRSLLLPTLVPAPVAAPPAAAAAAFALAMASEEVELELEPASWLLSLFFFFFLFFFLALDSSGATSVVAVVVVVAVAVGSLLFLDFFFCGVGVARWGVVQFGWVVCLSPKLNLAFYVAVLATEGCVPQIGYCCIPQRSSMSEIKRVANGGQPDGTLLSISSCCVHSARAFLTEHPKARAFFEQNMSVCLRLDGLGAVNNATQRPPTAVAALRTQLPDCTLLFSVVGLSSMPI